MQNILYSSDSTSYDAGCIIEDAVLTQSIYKSVHGVEYIGVRDAHRTTYSEGQKSRKRLKHMFNTIMRIYSNNK